MQSTTGREFLHTLGRPVIGLVGLPAARPAAAPADGTSMTPGFSLYGMKALKAEDAIKAVAQIGYDSVELCLMPEWDATPGRLEIVRKQP